MIAVHRQGRLSGLAVGAVAAMVAVALSVAAGTASATTRPSPLGWANAKQVAEFTAPNGAEYDGFGAGAALSGNGQVAVVGAPYHSNFDGAAYVFTETSKGWRQSAELTPPDAGPFGEFGYSVAVSNQGRVVVVGAVSADGDKGAAYVFTEAGGRWTEAAELTASDGVAKDSFSYAVSVSGNGSTVLISSLRGDDGTGAAYVFTRSGKKSWPQIAELTVADHAGFGSVSLTPDGSTAVVGGGARAFVVVDSGGTWTRTATLRGGAGGVSFGDSVAVSGDGSVIVVGDAAQPPTDYIGAAYVFTRSGGSYTRTDKLTASDGEQDDFFGISVTVSRNGSVIAVGAKGRDGRTGAQYVFTGESGTWTQRAELIASDPQQGADFGYPSALSNDGSTLVVGADDGFNGAAGSAYIFAR